MDQGASVLAKLKNKSKQTGKPMQLHLQLFCQEEFLRRLSLSKYANHLILKGGLFIYTLTNFESRATIDVDFLLQDLSNNIDKIKEIINEILAVDTGNDFVEFTADFFKVITPERKYTGISCQVIGKIKNTKTPFNIDIGVGDVIVPSVEKRKIPVQIEGFDYPIINTYSLESTIAEKLDAILQRLEMTSRMKDYYDIYYLSQMFDFDGEKLKLAIKTTLDNRKTKYTNEGLVRVMGFKHNDEMIEKWKQYIKLLKLDYPIFTDVIVQLEVFLLPIWESMVIGDSFNSKWDKSLNKWVKQENNKLLKK